MKVTIELRGGSQCGNPLYPTKKDLDINIGAQKHAIENLVAGGLSNGISLRDTLTILEGIRKELP